MSDRPGPVRFASSFVAAVIACLIAVPGLAADNPRELLRRMDNAIRDLNYSGTLVHVNRGAAGVLQIVHRVEDGNISERITSLDGNAREIIREGEQLTCILPDQQSVLVEHRDPSEQEASPLREGVPDAAAFDDAHYELSLAGPDRAAGRLANVIEVRPRDNFRYGYRLWLDEESAMPLKSQLRDELGNVIEEILFANIYIADYLSPALLRPSLDTAGFTWHRSAETLPAETDSPARRSAWRARELPDGFKLIAARSKMPPGSTDSMEHLVYADGVASVSVFIEASVAASEQAEGLSMVGSANAYTTTRNGRLITAMGEVPARTVEMIALSVHNDQQD